MIIRILGSQAYLKPPFAQILLLLLSLFLQYIQINIFLPHSLIVGLTFISTEQLPR